MTSPALQVQEICTTEANRWSRRWGKEPYAGVPMWTEGAKQMISYVWFVSSPETVYPANHGFRVTRWVDIYELETWTPRGRGKIIRRQPITGEELRKALEQAFSGSWTDTGELPPAVLEAALGVLNTTLWSLVNSADELTATDARRELIKRATTLAWDKHREIS